MKKSDFHFDLPEELIAQQPLSERSASRLLHADAHRQQLTDRRFCDLPDLLTPGDLLVFNDTRVIPARLVAQKDSGGRVEVMIERVVGDGELIAQVACSKPLQPGRSVTLADGTRLRVLGRDGEFWRLRAETDESMEALLERVGQVPLPPYIRRSDQAIDRERYQTVFAATAGAVAAPTAGLHFDAALLKQLSQRGIQSGYITLHVGAGTFKPLRGDDVKNQVLHSEWLNVGADLVAKVRATWARGGRVVAVGTTVVRALETAAQSGELIPYSGETRIFIFPGYSFRVVDALVTNFHLPQSTLIMLVAAFAGREFVLQAYRHAVQRRYRFFSYGDAMLVEPPAEQRPANARVVLPIQQRE